MILKSHYEQLQSQKTKQKWKFLHQMPKHYFLKSRNIKLKDFEYNHYKYYIAINRDTLNKLVKY